ncbi:MAG: hypothetical protein RI556_12815, partial [Hydrogenovibrio sp.]|uniref:hypothetical protein n=1 Tax=Hydrogenovibrio sp. TaxID=2065821 RepID=UPI002870135C
HDGFYTILGDDWGLRLTRFLPSRFGSSQLKNFGYGTLPFCFRGFILSPGSGDTCAMAAVDDVFAKKCRLQTMHN